MHARVDNDSCLLLPGQVASHGSGELLQTKVSGDAQVGQQQRKGNRIATSASGTSKAVVLLGHK